MKFLPLCAVLAVLAACVSGGGAGGTAAETPAGRGTATIVVENTAAPGRGISVRLVSAGQDQLLGGVGPRETSTFEVETGAATSYRLVAGTTGGGEITSETFALRPGMTVRWVLPYNDVRMSN